MVIVKTSPLDVLYQDLPVIIVQDWKNITEEWLHRAFKEYSGYDMTMNDDIGIQTRTGTRTKQDGGRMREGSLLLEDSSTSNISKDNKEYRTKKIWVDGMKISRAFQYLLDQLTSSLFGSSVENKHILNEVFTVKKSVGSDQRRKWAYEKLTLAYWKTLFHSKAGLSPTMDGLMAHANTNHDHKNVHRRYNKKKRNQRR